MIFSWGMAVRQILSRLLSWMFEDLRLVTVWIVHRLRHV